MRPVELDESLISVVPESHRLLLVARYEAPPRAYHTIQHAQAVARHARDLGGDRACLLAAWFHDAVYDRQPGADEDRSARLLLGWLRQDPDAPEAARLVRLTAGHDPAEGDAMGAILCDADLAVLGADATGYAAYRDAIRLEHADRDEAAWRTGRAAVLRGLLARPELYRTATGADRWEAAARANLTAELAQLDAPDGAAGG